MPAHTHTHHLFVMAKRVLAYNLAVLTIFTALYWAIGFRENFHVPEDESGEASQLLYFSCMSHGLVGSPDVYPRTSLARALVSVHVLLVFAQIGGIVLFASTLHSGHRR